MYAPDFDYSRYVVRKYHNELTFRSPSHERFVVTALLVYARYCYYVLDAPVFTDWEYDNLERRCRRLYRGRLVPAWHPLRTVGSSNPEAYPLGIRRIFNPTLEAGDHR